MNEDYNLGLEIGRLTAVVNTLCQQAIPDLSSDIKALRYDMNEVKLFRAKVMGISLVVSLIASAVFQVGLAAWAK